jgi:hypothetical protein
MNDPAEPPRTATDGAIRTLTIYGNVQKSRAGSLESTLGTR